MSKCQGCNDKASLLSHSSLEMLETGRTFQVPVIEGTEVLLGSA